MLIPKFIKSAAASLAGGILGPVGDIIEKFVADPTKKQEAMLEIEKMNTSVTNKLIDFGSTLVQEQASVIRAEIGAGGLKAIWRPLVMLMFAFIIFNNYILYPYMQAIFGWAVEVSTPPDLWDLMKIGLGGYVVGRSVEQTAKHWKEK